MQTFLSKNINKVQLTNIYTKNKLTGCSNSNRSMMNNIKDLFEYKKKNYLFFCESLIKPPPPQQPQPKDRFGNNNNNKGNTSYYKNTKNYKNEKNTYSKDNYNNNKHKSSSNNFFLKKLSE